MAGFYTFIKGITGKLGVGVADQGYVNTQSIPTYSLYRPETAVQRSFAPLKPSFAMTDQNVPIVSQLGLTGAYPHGVPAFTPLASKGK